MNTINDLLETNNTYLLALTSDAMTTRIYYLLREAFKDIHTEQPITGQLFIDLIKRLKELGFSELSHKDNATVVTLRDTLTGLTWRFNYNTNILTLKNPQNS